MKYIAYYRVSSIQQKSSGLSLEAQRETVLQFIRNNGNKLIGEFTETESGKNDRRPQLLQAIALSKKEDATLVIAKLDRLSRNVSFISYLMDAHVRFVACDMPEATDFTIHIFAALAQQERKFISQRTKAALDAKRLREPEWKPGTPANLTAEGRVKSHEFLRRQASEDIRNRHAYHFMKPLIQGGATYADVARALNAEGYVTTRNNPWNLHGVRALWLRTSGSED